MTALSNLPSAVVHITRVPVSIPLTSGMMPLTIALNAVQIRYVLRWHELQKMSWRLGEALRNWGIWYYGSKWNGLAPILDDHLLLHRLGHSPERRIVHFIWGEYGTY